MLARLEGWAHHTGSLADRLEPRPLLWKGVYQLILPGNFVAVVSNFNTVITFLFDKKYSQRSRNSLPILHFCFRHLLGCVKQLFLLSNYYTGGVLQIPSDGDDPWKLKSTPKKNEYFEYLNKVSAKKRLVPKKISKRKISNQGKKRNSIIPVTWKNWPEYHPRPIPGQNIKFPQCPDWQSW